MPASTLSPKQVIAYKVGARARKFMLEDCVIEGYEVLLTSLAETKETEPELHALLQLERPAPPPPATQADELRGEAFRRVARPAPRDCWCASARVD